MPQHAGAVQQCKQLMARHLRAACGNQAAASAHACRSLAAPEGARTW
jgi:hypothetical protein